MRFRHREARSADSIFTPRGVSTSVQEFCLIARLDAPQTWGKSMKHRARVSAESVDGQMAAAAVSLA
jgi:uncharacterized membrane protein